MKWIFFVTNFNNNENRFVQIQIRWNSNIIYTCIYRNAATDTISKEFSIGARFIEKKSNIVWFFLIWRSMPTLTNRIFDKGFLPSLEVKVNVTFVSRKYNLFFPYCVRHRKRFLNAAKCSYNGNHYSYILIMCVFLDTIENADLIASLRTY